MLHPGWTNNDMKMDTPINDGAKNVMGSVSFWSSAMAEVKSKYQKGIQK